jgi:hypothetical protein
VANRYCRNCGHELGLEERLCPMCGRDANRDAHETGHVPKPEADVSVPPQSDQPSARSALPQTETPPLPPLPHLRPPTPSMLVYLFADRIFQQGGRALWKMRVPCKEDVTVAAKDLAAGIIAVSFLNLREQGFIRLEPSQKKKLFVGSIPALRVVKVNQIEEAKLIGRAAPEWLILGSLIDQAEDDDVRNLLKRWLVSGALRAAHLYELVIGMAATEAILFGYIESTSGEDSLQALKRVEKPVTLGSRVWKRPLRLAEGLEARCEKIATLEGRFEEFALRMQNIQSTEAELYGLLVDECAGAIDNGISDLDRPFSFRW